VLSVVALKEGRMEVRCGAEGVRRPGAVGKVIDIRHITTVTAVAIALLLTASAVRAAAPTDLAIHATATSFRVGVDGSYHVSVSNVGSVNTDAPVRVTSTLPVGLSFVSGGGAGFTCTGSGRSVECVTDGVPAGTTIAFSVAVDVCTTAAAVTTALSVSYDGDINGANDTTQRTTSVKAGQCSSRATTPTLTPAGPTRTPTLTGTPPPTGTPTPVTTDLQLTTTTARSFIIGTQTSYFHVVTNVGTAATNVPLTLVDTLPKGISFVSAEGDGWTCSASERTVTCTDPSPLDVGATSSLTLTVGVASDAYPSVTNVATLLYAADVDESDNTTRRPSTIRRPRPIRVRPGRRTPIPALASPTVAPPASTPTRTPTATPSPRRVTPTDLLLTKTSQGVFNVGRPAFYVLRVTNIGPYSTNAPITLTDRLPSSLGFVGASGGGWTCSVSGQTVSCTNPNPLAPGALTIINLSVSVSADAFPTVMNTATVTYANDTNTSNNTAHRPTTVRR
jgi:uncharacterized repeat protein (TIGR01451 family)